MHPCGAPTPSPLDLHFMDGGSGLGACLGLTKGSWPGKPASPRPLSQSNVAASNAKLALFYDWLFFSPDKDSIMNIGAWLPPASAARPAPPAAGLAEACPEPQGRVEWARPEQFCGPPGGSPGGAGRSLGGPRDPRPLSLLPGLGPGAVSAVEKAASSCLSSACQGRGRTRTTSLFGGRLLWGLPSGNGGLWGWAPALKRPSRCSSTEPAILVMHHSMKPHPAITATLLDFMCRVRAAPRARLPGAGRVPPGPPGREGASPALDQARRLPSLPRRVRVSAGLLCRPPSGGAAGPRFSSPERAGTSSPSRG